MFTWIYTFYITLYSTLTVFPPTSYVSGLGLLRSGTVWSFCSGTAPASPEVLSGERQPHWTSPATPACGAPAAAQADTQTHTQN